MTSSPLDIDQILRETFIARAEYHLMLRSTNDRAAQCAAEAPGPLPLLVVAEMQTAGRGRGGRHWWTGRGSLAVSLLLDPQQLGIQQRSQSPLVTLAAAVAIVETVAPLLRGEPVGIHWPNDVVATGGKLAGILVEVLPDGQLIVGIGVNTNNSLADAPPELRGMATTLLELTGREHDQTTLLVTLLEHLESALRQLESAPEQIGARADAMCLQHDCTLTLQLGNQSITGRCVGIAADGALVLEMPHGRRAFYSGVLQP